MYSSSAVLAIHYKGEESYCAHFKIKEGELDVWPTLASYERKIIYSSVKEVPYLFKLYSTIHRKETHWIEISSNLILFALVAQYN